MKNQIDKASQTSTKSDPKEKPGPGTSVSKDKQTAHDPAYLPAAGEEDPGSAFEELRPD